MQIDLDTDALRSSMTLWRDSVDLKMPMADEFKVHFMSQRRSILGNFVNTANAWLMLLRSCKALDSGQNEFAGIVSEVKSFHDWAQAELQSLQILGKQASLTKQVQGFLKRPKSED